MVNFNKTFGKSSKIGASPNFVVLLIICAACLLAYSNCLTNPFIWDDNALVVKNTLIRSGQNLGASFTNDLYLGTNSGSNFYRPLQTLSYIFDYHFWQLNSFGYHLTNIILQIGVSFLVFLLLLSLLESSLIALAASVFFAVSPLNTEAVTYISGRAEMLMGFFAILSLLLFIKSQKDGVKNPALIYILSVVSFILALLSKEAAVVVPFIIWGYLFYYLHTRIKEKYYFIKKSFPFFALSLIYLGLRVLFLKFSISAAPSLAKVPWLVRLSVLPKVIFTYLKLLIFPVDLHMSREFAWQSSNLGILVGVICLGLIIFACIYLLRYQRKNKAGYFMIFWAIVFFIPQSGIFPINAFIAEHFIYLSSISFFMFLAYFLHKFLRRQLFVVAIVGLSVFYVLLTAARNIEWANPIIFYKNIIKYSPKSFQAHNNLGQEYEFKGLDDLAQAEYKKALEIKPNLLEAHANLAKLYFKLKRYTDSTKEYEIVEKHCPLAKAGEVENNIGNIYEAEGLTDKAIEKYKLALKFTPDIKFAHFNLARIYYAKGDADAAGLHILESLTEITDRAKAIDCKVIASFLKTAGNIENAEQFYNNLGVCFTQRSRWEAAASAFSRALELNPSLAVYYYNLGLTYYNMGEYAKAKIALKQALRIEPNHSRAKGLISDLNSWKRKKSLISKIRYLNEKYR